MPELWFWIVAVMVAIYVVLDGFDFGAGALHLIVARTDAERRQVLRAIGPLWDANEVWLLASGGALFVAFPRALAVSFSGLYLAMFLVLWTLIGRGIAIEFRSHVADPLWRAFWDVMFSVVSLLLAVLFGVALGNVIRGVPIGPDGTFELALFTTFRPADAGGLLDWYTVLVGVFAALALAMHGALFLAWKTSGAVQARSGAAARLLGAGMILLWIAATAATSTVNPGLFAGMARPLALLSTAVLIAGLGTLAMGLRQRRYLVAFLGSGAFILGLLAATAALAFPVLLRSTVDPAQSLTIWNAASSSAGLRKGLGWWLVGFPIALGYFTYLFRAHRGQVPAAADGDGY